MLRVHLRLRNFAGLMRPALVFVVVTALSFSCSAWERSRGGARSGSDAAAGAAPVAAPGNAETEAHRLDKAKAENGVVNLAGLLFQQCSSGQESQLNVCTGTAVSMNHFRAQDYCERLALGNRRWRLPTRAELETMLLKDRPYIPLTDPTVFPATAAQAYWTASDFHGSDHSYWVVDFQRGKSVGKDIFKSAYVRCVSPK